MGLIMNASSEEQQTRVFGNYFTFKPGQIKQMDKKVSHWISTERKYLGFVSLPDKFEDLDYRGTAEGKATLAAAKAEGIQNRIASLNSLIQNEEVSLVQDLEKAGMNANAVSYKSPALEAAYTEIVKYQQKQEDTNKKREENLKKLRKKLHAE